MKLNIKKLVIWLAIIMAASFGIAAIILVTTGSFSVVTEQIDKTKNFSAEGVEKVNIDIVSTDINIIASDGENIKVHFYGEVSTNIRKDIPELAAYVSGDQLYIEIIHPKTIFIGVNIWRTNMDIYIPGNSIDDIEINTVSADTNIEDLEIDDFVYSSVSGDFKARSLFARDLKLESTSGSFDIKDYAGNIDINVTSGDIVLNGGSDNDSIGVITVSGAVNIEQLEEFSSMNAETTSGDVEIKLFKDAQFYLNASTVSGDINNEFSIKISSSGRRGLEGTVGSDDMAIIVSTTSGDININY